jgi:transcriptional regulator with XRE-family HTH domain
MTKGSEDVQAPSRVCTPDRRTGATALREGSDDQRLGTIAIVAILVAMNERNEVLRGVMLETGATQSELSRLSGVRQPSISQFLSGRVEMSDNMLDRLLSCMGFRLEVIRRPVRRELSRSSERSWQLHRRLSTHLNPETLDEWRPTILRNLKRLRRSIQGQPHMRNLDRWQQLVRDRDVPGLRQVMTGLDTGSVEMREVSPMGGLMSQDERSEVLGLTV